MRKHSLIKEFLVDSEEDASEWFENLEEMLHGQGCYQVQVFDHT